MKNTNDNQYAEYIDNEEICLKKGIPCTCGIPCCSKCSIAGAIPILRSPALSCNKILK
jgi:hypothetical protein